MYKLMMAMIMAVLGMNLMFKGGSGGGGGGGKTGRGGLRGLATRVMEKPKTGRPGARPTGRAAFVLGRGQPNEGNRG